MESGKRNSVWDEVQYRHLKHTAESSLKVCWPLWVPACTWKHAGFSMAKKLKKTECLEIKSIYVTFLSAENFWKCVKPFALGRAGFLISLTILAALDQDKTGGMLGRSRREQGFVLGSARDGFFHPSLKQLMLAVAGGEMDGL